MNILTLSGWAQPADALGLNGRTFDFSDYASPEESFAPLSKYRETEHVIGWSTGGYLAIRAVAEGILKPKKLTLIGAPYQFVSNQNFRRGMDPITYQQFYDSYAKDPSRTKQRFHALTAKGDRHAKRIVGELQHHPDVENTARWLPWLDALNNGSFHGRDLSMLPQTTIIQGHNDNVVSHAQGEALAAAIPNATLDRWDEAGHAPHLHDRERLLASLNA